MRDSKQGFCCVTIKWEYQIFTFSASCCTSTCCHQMANGWFIESRVHGKGPVHLDKYSPLTLDLSPPPQLIFLYVTTHNTLHRLTRKSKSCRSHGFCTVIKLVVGVPQLFPNCCSNFKEGKQDDPDKFNPKLTFHDSFSFFIYISLFRRMQIYLLEQTQKI